LGIVCTLNLIGRFRLSQSRILNPGAGVAKRIEVVARTLLETVAVRPEARSIGSETAAEEFLDCVTARTCLPRELQAAAFSRTLLITRSKTSWGIVSATVRDKAFWK
jgi:hypothetical protein